MSEAEKFTDYALSETESLLVDRPSAALSTQAFLTILREEIAGQQYREQELYRSVLAGLEQRLPTIMSRSLQSIYVTPKEVWTDILEALFGSNTQIAIRRRMLGSYLSMRIAGQLYRVRLDDNGPTSLLETIVFPSDPVPVLSATEPWPKQNEAS